MRSTTGFARRNRRSATRHKQGRVRRLLLYRASGPVRRRMASGLRENGSIRRCLPKPSGRRSCFASRWPAPRNVFGIRIGASELSQSLIGRMPDQSFETEPHCFCIRHRATGFLRVAKGGLINVERFLHTSKITIFIQRYQPYLIGVYAEGTKTARSVSSRNRHPAQPIAADSEDISSHPPAPPNDRQPFSAGMGRFRRAGWP